ncbi:hypothetical protein [Levilactobacillus cerevisiae]|uniref:hypothetical protein n=1 Tax=Levilactobacillus cerevisiae TaxID=1704076 RepID=UPI000F76FB6F|nr:hypothetical protein [Levilactobacillus cerevisiae]
MSVLPAQHPVRTWLWHHIFILIVIALSFLAALPQLTSQSAILGVDGLFHFNRFYDIAMQLKHLNFHYFVAPYEYQGMGRMVNSIYGPFAAGLNGVLLLLAGSYVKYQVLSRVILSVVAAECMYVALRRCRVTNLTAQAIAILYPFTYQIIMWNIRQSFMSWGAALMPLGVMVGVRMLENREHPINIWQTAVVMALLTQTHLISAAQIALMLLLYAIIAVRRLPNRRDFLLKIGQAILLYLVLCANVIAGLVEIFMGNRILGVGQVKYPGENAFNVLVLHRSRYLILVVLVASLVILLIGWRKLSFSTKVTASLGTGFYVLSSVLLPWDTIFRLLPVISFIQFPSRFMAVGTVLLLVADGQLLSTTILGRGWNNLLRLGIAGLGVLLIGVNGYSTTQHTQQIFAVPRAIYPAQKYATKELENLRTAFNSSNLAKPLTLATKSTPDYLPLQPNYKPTDNVFAAYEELDHVLYHRGGPHLHQTIGRHSTTLRWTGTKAQSLTLPVAMYRNTQAVLNGHAFQYRNNPKQTLRLATVQSRTGQNTFTFHYQPRLISRLLLWVTAIGWLGMIIWWWHSRA